MEYALRQRIEVKQNPHTGKVLILVVMEYALRRSALSTSLKPSAMS